MEVAYALLLRDAVATVEDGGGTAAEWWCCVLLMRQAEESEVRTCHLGNGVTACLAGWMLDTGVETAAAAAVTDAPPATVTLAGHSSWPLLVRSCTVFCASG